MILEQLDVIFCTGVQTDIYSVLAVTSEANWKSKILDRQKKETKNNKTKKRALDMDINNFTKGAKPPPSPVPTPMISKRENINSLLNYEMVMKYIYLICIQSDLSYKYGNARKIWNMVFLFNLIKTSIGACGNHLNWL